MAGSFRQPKWFQCFLGSKARDALLHNGGSPDSFRLLVAASGGPRWIGLVSIDRCLKKFVSQRDRKNPLALLGASSGAWRMAAMACLDKGESYEDLVHEYVEQSFEGSPTPREVSEVCRAYLRRVFSPQRVLKILSNPRFQLNFTTALIRQENPSQITVVKDALASCLANAFDRRLLKWVIRRCLFSVLPHPTLSPLGEDWDALGAERVALGPENFYQALMATGSIPLVLEGESSIPGSPSGHHLDGGWIDYHFEIESPGPILYPHFDPNPIPGWLDKFPPYRKITRRARENLCLILPSEELLALFPTQDYPCREDFHKYPNAIRVKLWRETLEVAKRVESELMACLESGQLPNVGKPL